MKRIAGIVFVVALIAAAQHREALSQWGNMAFAKFRSNDTDASGPTAVKCFTKDGVSYFMSLPADVTCDRTEIIHFKPRAGDRDNESQPAPSKFVCDGRQYCTHMTSCDEARFSWHTARTPKWTVTMMAYRVNDSGADRGKSRFLR